MISIAQITENPRLILVLLRKFWMLLVFTALLGGTVAFICNRLTIPKYTANISLLIWNRDIGKMETDNDRFSQRNRVQEGIREAFSYNNLVFSSLQVAQRLTPAFTKLVNSPEVRRATNKRLLQQNFQEPLNYNVKCNAKKQSCIIDLYVTSLSPKLAAAAANALAECFSAEQQRLMNVKYIQAITPASIPESPSGPNKNLILFLGSFGGLVLGIGIAFCIEMADVTVKTNEDIKALNLLTLGLLPQVSEVETLFKNEKIDLHGRFHLIIDAVRVINTTVDFLRVNNPLKIIGVTSALPNSGKTTSVILLAKAMGASHKRVLIIDCDLRKPKLRKNLALPDGKGLVDFLISPEDTDPETFIRRNVFPGVDAMDNALIPPNPTELLGTQRFRKMLARLKESYDCILFDCPPGLNMADAMVAGSIVDGIVLIAEAGHTRNKDIQLLLEQFGSLKEKILGVILNKVSLTGSEYSYYSYYGHNINTETT
ncbi:MAG: polysaccharide biosynthesis tyrosine autokinase [Victivallales bacterium]|nr:polysaccharide biosynthesis tyrosine autokinase [Victivallales bacterium]